MNIPAAPGLANQRFTCTLDGVRYRVGLRWNGSIRTWFLDLALADGTSLVKSKGLRCGADVLAQKRHDPRIPPGVLFVVPLQDVRSDPGLDAWGSTHRLVYNPAGT